jgi:hypothetical protein
LYKYLGNYLNLNKSMQHNNEENNSPGFPDDFEFFERQLEEVDGGYYDANGFYCTPDGSFWDEDGVYFCRYGFDRHGGVYDNYGVYIPGQGWNEELDCYEDEITPNLPGNQELKTAVNDNINEELAEGFQYYRKYFKNLDKEEVDEVEPEEEEMHRIYHETLNLENRNFQMENNNLMQNNTTIPQFLNQAPQINNFNQGNDENFNRMNVTPSIEMPMDPGHKIMNLNPNSYINQSPMMNNNFPNN